MRKLSTMLLICFLFLMQVAVAGGPPSRSTYSSDSGLDPYVSVSIGETEVDELKGTLLNDDDSVFNIAVGAKLNQNFAVEGGYVDLGEYGFTKKHYSAKAEADAIYIAAVGSLPVSNKVALTGKVGLAFWDIKVTESLLEYVDISKEDGTDVFYGIGASVKVSKKVNLVADYTVYDLDGLDVELYSVGFQFKF